MAVVPHLVAPRRAAARVPGQVVPDPLLVEEVVGPRIGPLEPVGMVPPDAVVMALELEAVQDLARQIVMGDAVGLRSAAQRVLVVRPPGRLVRRARPRVQVVRGHPAPAALADVASPDVHAPAQMIEQCVAAPPVVMRHGPRTVPVGRTGLLSRRHGRGVEWPGGAPEPPPVVGSSVPPGPGATPWKRRTPSGRPQQLVEPPPRPMAHRPAPPMLSDVRHGRRVSRR